MKEVKKIMGFVVLALVCASPSLGHGGGLDANGGHYNNKTGKYHCHQKAKNGSPCKPKPDRPPKPADQEARERAAENPDPELRA